MPIKLPKGLKPRRKSSTQALDEADTPARSSFRVIEREPSKSLDGFSGGTKLMSQAGRPLTYHPANSGAEDLYAEPENVESRFDMRRATTQPILMIDRRKSGATLDSNSTGPANHSAASSMRLSASSTVPSSTDLTLEARREVIGRKPLPEPPAGSRQSARPGAAARASSYGPRSMTPSSVDAYERNFERSFQRREFSATPSSTSTATPPKLLDSEFALGSDMDDFGNMFDALDKRKSRDRTPRSTAREGSPASAIIPSPAIARQRSEEDSIPRRHIPSPINVDRTTEIEQSPFSWSSNHSNEGLMASTSPVSSSSPPIERTAFTRKPPPSSWQYGSALASATSRNDNIRRTPSPLKEVSNFEPQKLSRVEKIENQASGRKEKALVRDAEDLELEAAIIDSSLAASARLAAEYENQEPAKEVTRTANKVMTKAQFERYRQEHEARSRSEASKADQSDDEDQEDEDETEAERTRQAMRQRRKQEAHLSIYRQTMMKVTGEKNEAPAVSITRPSTNRASTSLPNLGGRLSSMNFPGKKSPASGLSSEDEDEDVPLGILAAHGFPNKNRPPSSIAGMRPKSSVSLRTDAQNPVPRPASASGEPTVSRAGNLPEFARKLPKDPYYGAGLVNPSNRESLAMGGGVPTRGLTPPGLPPGGLVGVIAGEERARAMRRGSPNPEGSAPAQQPGMMAYGMPAYPQGDQAQLQMQAQMNQMMQMQWQWMQWMMQNQGQGSPMTPPIPGQIPGSLPPSVSASSLPLHLQHPLPNSSHLSVPQEQRTRSMVNPQMAPWNRPVSGFMGGPAVNQSYAPSIAPSERSNIGMASRYRPVSIAPSVNAHRASTFTAATLNPWQVGPPPVPAHSQAPSTVRPVPEDDEDEQAWAEMKRKREEKKSARRSKKDQQGLAALYPTGI